MNRREKAVLSILCAVCLAAPASARPAPAYAAEIPAGRTAAVAGNARTAAGNAQTAADAGSGNAQTAADAAAEGAQTAEIPETSGAWELVGREWRFFFADGSLARNSWIRYHGEWYYMDSYGYMVTEKRRVNGITYYFREDGTMATGWLYDSAKDRWYYADRSGCFHTGWLKAGGSWYYFNSSGRMISGGRQMVDGAMYSFFAGGKLVASGWQGLNYYNADGIRDASHDIRVQGKRSISTEEKNGITEAFSRIPPYWVQRFIDEGWELICYSDRKYFSAPMTDRGIYYVRYKTDTVYKKIKFTDPDALVMAFGEFIADAQENDENSGKNTAASPSGGLPVTISDVAAGYNRYVEDNGGLEDLPSYFSDTPEMIFAKMFANYVTPSVRADIRTEDPGLACDFDCLLRVYSENSKPEAEEMDEEGTYEPRDGNGSRAVTGPAGDQSLKRPKASGPALESTDTG